MNDEICTRCNNDGFIIDDNDCAVTCPLCNGHLEQVCEHCNNTGMIGDSLKYCDCKIDDFVFRLVDNSFLMR